MELDQVFVRILANLLHIYKDRGDYDKVVGILDQLLIIKPNSAEEILSMLRVLIIQQRYRDVLERIQRLREEHHEGIQQNILDMFETQVKPHMEEHLTPKRRNEGNKVSLHIGQIISHKRFGYKGVVIGWDEVCEASDHWKEQMGVDQLPHGANQPYYTILVDGRNRANQTTYVAQENVEKPIMTEAIIHSELGRFFEGFDPQASVYIPNEELKQQYPDL